MSDGEKQAMPSYEPLDVRYARVGRLRAQLKSVDDQIQHSGKPERVKGLLDDRERIIRNLHELNDDAFLSAYLAADR
jgi:hypothetical protein